MGNFSYLDQGFYKGFPKNKFPGREVSNKLTDVAKNKKFYHSENRSLNA